MKKTIIALMALAGMATGQEPGQEKVTWTYDTGTASTTAFSTWYGIQFTLSNTATSYGITSSIEDALFEESQTLMSITLNNVKGPYSNGIMGVVYDSATNTVLGKVNSNKLTTNTGTLTFDFSNSAITLNTKSTYAITFTSANNNAFTVDSTLPDGGHYLKVAVYTSADSTYTADSNLAYDDVVTTSVSSGAIPGIRIVTTSAYVVPEPTTATLSLLALAGLAARRRRK